jgi:hypothetical protein
MSEEIWCIKRCILRAGMLFSVFCLTTGAKAQWLSLHGGSVSVGGFGQFTTQLTDPQGTAGTYSVPFQTGATTYSTTIFNQSQYTTDSAGFVTSLGYHPKPWAGMEFNYAFTHYSERFLLDYGATGTQTLSVPVDVHEATGAYQFHPRYIPFQPFVNIGGGAIDFAPIHTSNQWRGAGLLEVGFDVPTHSKHIGFRIEGRSLFYRAPNFDTPAISTRTWRAIEEPTASTYYRF